MNKKITFLSVVLTCLGLTFSLTAKAQGQDSNHQWNGNPLTSFADNANEDEKIVYLYNVGTKKFLNTGSYWGTIVVGFNVGMPMTIKSSTGGKYEMLGALVTYAGSKIAFGRRKDTPGWTEEINYNHVYIDRGAQLDNADLKNPFGPEETYTNGVIHWTFKETATGSKTYYIYCNNDEATQGYGGDRYLQMASTSVGETYTMNYPSYNNGINDIYGQWKIVTKKDLKEAFKEQYASDEKPADATFLIYDQNYERGHKEVGKWVATGVQGTFNAKFLFDTSKNGECYYVGNGAQKDNYYMAKYAGYSTANIRNLGYSNPNGKITQSVTTLKKGWYRVTCNGFYKRANNSSTLKAKMFAKVQGHSEPRSNMETELQMLNDNINYTKEAMTKVYVGTSMSTTDEESPYVKAGKLFGEDKYENSILVYVPTDGGILNIGIEVSGSNQELDWTSWDNFQLQYCGNRDMVLSELEEDLNYMTQQVETNVSNTLILKRTMKVNQWSSLVLPVNLTASQVKAAFGDQVKLSEMPKQSTSTPTRIDFKKVDLTNDDATVIQANKLYIIRPTKEPTGTGTDPYIKQLKNHRIISVPAPYYVINSVTLDTDPAATYSDGIVKETSTSSTTSDSKLQFCGTFIKKTDKVIPAYSYVLGANDGKWYYTQNPNAVKGFRCWIATGSEAQAKNIHFFIDGIEESTITGIDNIISDTQNKITDGKVYDINGRLVRSNTENLDSLPKGLYIINHKKYVIK